MSTRHHNVTPGHTLSADGPRPTHDLHSQCLRVLRCTARAMAASPGGLRFKAGTRPWLEGLESGLGHQPLAGGHLLQPLMLPDGNLPPPRRTH